MNISNFLISVLVVTVTYPIYVAGANNILLSLNITDKTEYRMFYLGLLYLIIYILHIPKKYEAISYSPTELIY